MTNKRTDSKKFTGGQFMLRRGPGAPWVTAEQLGLVVKGASISFDSKTAEQTEAADKDGQHESAAMTLKFPAAERAMFSR